MLGDNKFTLEFDISNSAAEYIKLGMKGAQLVVSVWSGSLYYGILRERLEELVSDIVALEMQLRRKDVSAKKRISNRVIARGIALTLIIWGLDCSSGKPEPTKAQNSEKFCVMALAFSFTMCLVLTTGRVFTRRWASSIFLTIVIFL